MRIGKAAGAGTPSLGGQQAPYTLIQLFVFRAQQHRCDTPQQIADLAYFVARMR